MPKQNSQRCVAIVWTDINSFDGAWLELEESKKLQPVQMETIGWIVNETKDHVVIVSTLEAKGSLAGSTNAIPRGIIKKIIPVKHDRRAS